MSSLWTPLRIPIFRNVFIADLLSDIGTFMQSYGQIRRRDGAAWWSVFRDLEQADVFLETFLVTSWAEHVRQHERFTRGDEEVEARIRQYVEGEPVIQHLIQAEITS